MSFLHIEQILLLYRIVSTLLCLLTHYLGLFYDFVVLSKNSFYPEVFIGLLVIRHHLAPVLDIFWAILLHVILVKGIG